MPAPPTRQLTNSISGDMDWRDEVEFLASAKRGQFNVTTTHEGSNFVIKAGSSMDVDGALVTFSSDENYATGQPRIVTNHGLTTLSAMDANSTTVIIAGTGGVIKRSTDRGLNWTTVFTTPDAQSVTCIKYLGGRWIVLTGASYLNPNNRAYIYVSNDDGLNYTGTAYTTVGSHTWSDVAYNGSDLYVVVGGYSGTTDYNYVTSSSNGTTWATPYALASAQAELGLSAIVYADGKFVTTGRCRSVYNSANANPSAAGSWTSRTFVNELYGYPGSTNAYYTRYLGYVLSGATKSVVMGSGDGSSPIWISTDQGTTWGAETWLFGQFESPTNIKGVNNFVFYCRNKADGENEFLHSATIPTTSTSSWTLRDTFSSVRIMDLCWDGTYYFLRDDDHRILVMSSFPTKNRAYAVDGSNKSNSIIATPVYDGKKKGYYVAGSNKRIFSFYKGWGKIQTKNKKLGAQT